MALTFRNAELDRLSRDLIEAENLLRELAGHDARHADAMTFVRQERLAEYYARHREQTLAVADLLREYVERLRDREPLWDNATTHSLRTARKAV
jgi:hypothetical protein